MKTASKTVTVSNPQGLHARPADSFARLASTFESSVEIIKGNETVDGKSILSILTLAAVQGTRLEIRAEGSDADDATVALAELVENDFQEPS